MLWQGGCQPGPGLREQFISLSTAPLVLFCSSGGVGPITLITVSRTVMPSQATEQTTGMALAALFVSAESTNS